MSAMQAHLALAGSYAAGALDGEDLAGYQAHLAAGCAACEAEIGDHLLALSQGVAPSQPEGALRDRVLDLAQAPTLPIDFTSYAWEEPVPGIRLFTLREEPERGVRKVLVWAQPGARYPAHRHLGDENILVLRGRIRDHRRTYDAGDICHSAVGFVHSEEVLPGPQGEDCICFVVYYGGHEAVAE